MGHLNASHWPIIVACALLVIAALINARSQIVPNRLTLSAILAGWFMAFVLAGAKGLSSGGSPVVASISAAVVGLILLLPFYKKCGLGAGCVKMQMAFGAWVGCALDLPSAAFVTAFATAVGMLFTAIGVLLATWRVRALGVRTIGGSSAADALFPAQATLSMGSVCGVLTAVVAGWL